MAAHQMDRRARENADHLPYALGYLVHALGLRFSPLLVAVGSTVAGVVPGAALLLVTRAGSLPNSIGWGLLFVALVFGPAVGHWSRREYLLPRLLIGARFVGAFLALIGAIRLTAGQPSGGRPSISDLASRRNRLSLVATVAGALALLGCALGELLSY